MGILLFLLFIVVPLLELVVIIQVGQFVGVLPTVLLLLGISLAGAALVKHEGIRAWRRFRQAMAEGRVPAKEVADGALLLLGGALLLTPGFLTDAVGLALLIPVTRSAVRGLLRRRITFIGPSGPSSRQTSSRQGSSRQGAAGQGAAGQGAAGQGAAGQGNAGSRRSDADQGVIDVEVVEVKRNEEPGDRGGS